MDQHVVNPGFDQAAYAPVGFVPRDINIEHHEEGVITLTNQTPVETIPKNCLEPFKGHAAAIPEKTWLAEKGPDGTWQHLSFREGWVKVQAIASWLLKESFSAPYSLMILSGNSLNHGMLTYGSMLAKLPVTPVSVGFSLMGASRERLVAVVDDIQPSLIYVEDGAMFQAALNALDLKDRVVIYGRNPPKVSGRLVAFDELVQTCINSEAIEESYETLGHDDVAKYLLTSGSTGTPKAVINTHGMLCWNAALVFQLFTDNRSEDVFLDWLPWSHTFGGNANLNGAMYQGITTYIDAGKPLPGMFETTIQNIKEISPTVYLNVPAGFQMLIARLEADEEFAKLFFKRLKFLTYGGAKLPKTLHDQMQRLAVRYTGKKRMFLSGYGSTETAPVATHIYWQSDAAGLIGLPIPGVTIKLIPWNNNRYELRIKGPICTPGYLNHPELNQQIYDEEGFYCIKDLVSFVDPDDPLEGLTFQGRVAEEFKLNSGTWVCASVIRIKVVEALAPLAQDVLITGLGQNEIGLMIWLSPAGAKFEGDVVGAIAQLLKGYNEANPGSSTKVGRFLVLQDMPSYECGEINDKGYVNQVKALDNRADLVERLYRNDDPVGVRV